MRSPALPGEMAPVSIAPWTAVVPRANSCQAAGSIWVASSGDIFVRRVVSARKRLDSSGYTSAVLTQKRRPSSTLASAASLGSAARSVSWGSTRSTSVRYDPMIRSMARRCNSESSASLESKYV